MVLQPPTILRLGAGPVRLHACQSPAQSGRADMRPAQHPAAAQRAVHKCSSIVSSSCASRASDMHASPWHAAQQAVVGFVRMEAPQNAQVPDTPSWSRTGGCTMPLDIRQDTLYIAEDDIKHAFVCVDWQGSGSAVLQLYGHLSSDTIVKWLAGTAIGHGLGPAAEQRPSNWERKARHPSLGQEQLRRCMLTTDYMKDPCPNDICTQKSAPTLALFSRSPVLILASTIAPKNSSCPAVRWHEKGLQPAIGQTRGCPQSSPVPDCVTGQLCFMHPKRSSSAAAAPWQRLNPVAPIPGCWHSGVSGLRRLPVTADAAAQRLLPMCRRAAEFQACQYPGLRRPLVAASPSPLSLQLGPHGAGRPQFPEVSGLRLLLVATALAVPSELVQVQFRVQHRLIRRRGLRTVLHRAIVRLRPVKVPARDSAYTFAACCVLT